LCSEAVPFLERCLLGVGGEDAAASFSSEAGLLLGECLRKKLGTKLHHAAAATG
jgi:hypothetical protein